MAAACGVIRGWWQFSLFQGLALENAARNGRFQGTEGSVCWLSPHVQRPIAAQFW
jgi:hypothetical protein